MYGLATSRLALAVILLWGIMLAGCADEERLSDGPVAAETPETASAPAEATDRDVSSPASQGQTADPAGSESPDDPQVATELDSTDESALAEFEPPFPERSNPFLAPKRSAPTQKQNGSQEQASVELLGFANVGQQKAILSIDGKVIPVVEGQKEGSVEVISIQPPAVVLQSNRERWQVTLEN